MKHQELVNFLEFTGKDPSRLIFEDELTDIYNRRFLFHYFEHKVNWTQLENNPISLIMMDVDYFKQVNDSTRPSGRRSGTGMDRIIAERCGRR